MCNYIVESKLEIQKICATVWRGTFEELFNRFLRTYDYDRTQHCNLKPETNHIFCKGVELRRDDGRSLEYQSWALSVSHQKSRNYTKRVKKVQVFQKYFKNKYGLYLDPHIVEENWDTFLRIQQEQETQNTIFHEYCFKDSEAFRLLFRL